jgi:CIC family chloride channel protein
VLAGQELLGLFTLTDAQRIPRDQWATTSVYKAMTPVERLRTVEPKEDAIRVLQIMGESDINQVPVVDGRLLVGIVSRADLLRLIQIRRAAANEQ